MQKYTSTTVHILCCLIKVISLRKDKLSVFDPIIQNFFYVKVAAKSIEDTI